MRTASVASPYRRWGALIANAKKNRARGQVAKARRQLESVLSETADSAASRAPVYAERALRLYLELSKGALGGGALAIEHKANIRELKASQVFHSHSGGREESAPSLLAKTLLADSLGGGELAYRTWGEEAGLAGDLTLGGDGDCGAIERTAFQPPSEYAETATRDAIRAARLLFQRNSPMRYAGSDLQWNRSLFAAARRELQSGSSVGAGVGAFVSHLRTLYENSGGYRLTALLTDFLAALLAAFRLGEASATTERVSGFRANANLKREYLPALPEGAAASYAPALEMRSGLRATPAPYASSDYGRREFYAPASRIYFAPLREGRIYVVYGVAQRYSAMQGLEERREAPTAAYIVLQYELERDFLENSP